MNRKKEKLNKIELKLKTMKIRKKQKYEYKIGVQKRKDHEIMQI